MRPAQEIAANGDGPFKFEPPELLDVVSWSYGFAHSWALRWMLRQPELLERLLPAVDALEITPPFTLGDVVIERQFGSARADLAFVVRGGGGSGCRVALETKVNDRVSDEQLAAYVAENFTPVLYLPGLTGLLLSNTQLANADHRLPGAALCAAVAEVKQSLPRFIGSYVDAVQAEALRFAEAREAARGERRWDRVRKGASPEEPLRAVAWVAELHGALAATAAEHEVNPAATARSERNDYGIFWHGCAAAVPTAEGAGSWLYIDVLVSRYTGERSVAVKAGYTRGSSMAAAYDFARAAGPPAPSGWLRAPRRVGGGSVTVWKRPVADDAPLEDVVQVALAAALWIRNTCA